MHSTSFLRFIAVEKLVVFWTTLFLTASLLYAGLWRGLKMAMGLRLRSGGREGVEGEGGPISSQGAEEIAFSGRRRWVSAQDTAKRK